MRVEKYDLLAIGDAGRLLNLSTSALRNWVDAGELKCLLASDGSRLFTEKQIEDFRRKREKRQVRKA
jgi:DNA-binding transcriptional MerR regulator